MRRHEIHRCKENPEIINNIIESKIQTIKNLEKEKRYSNLRVYISMSIIKMKLSTKIDGGVTESIQIYQSVTVE